MGFKCKYCGEFFSLEKVKNNKDNVFECDVCGNLTTLPTIKDNQKLVNLLQKGEDLLSEMKFKEATIIFEEALKIKEDAEIYFDLFLSKINVNYIHDKRKKRLQPLIHKICEEDIENDEFLLKAYELSSLSQKKEYESKVKEIIYINKSFKEYQKTLPEYDTFICVKVTDETNKRTLDSALADKIYDILSKNGYYPFYSEREIKNQVGADYEALILYALMSCKSLIVITSDKRYLRTPWVENEYSRYIELLNKGLKNEDSILMINLKDKIDRLFNYDKNIKSLSSLDATLLDEVLSLVKKHSLSSKNIEELSSEEKEAIKDELRKELQKQKEEKKKEALRYEEERLKRIEETKFTQFSQIDGEILIKYNGNEEIVKIPSFIKIIGDSAFKENKKIKKIILPEGLIKICSCAFENCQFLEEINFPSSLEIIESNAFYKARKLKKFIQPSSLKRIEKNVFSGCENLKELILDENVTLENIDLWDDNKLEKLVIKGEIEEEISLWTNNSLQEIILPSKVKAKKMSLREVNNIKTLIVPEGIQEFVINSRLLEEITLPSTIEKINNIEFISCDSLKRIKIPSSWGMFKTINLKKVAPKQAKIVKY